LASTPSNFHFASGVAPARASRFFSLEPGRRIGRDHQRQRQRGRNELGETPGEEGGRVGRDRGREGRLDEGAADQRRVEDIEADAAEQRLAQGDGDDARHRAHP
jgi:hypothetical protein